MSQLLPISFAPSWISIGTKFVRPVFSLFHRVTYEGQGKLARSYRR